MDDVADSFYPYVNNTNTSSIVARLLNETLDDDDAAVQDGSLSEGQEMALSLIPIFTGLLSAWGSASIIVMVYRIDRRSRNCYNRIMFGLSCSDLLSSIVLSLQSFLLPKETSHRVWASGNDASCTAMGFFQQLSLGSIFYSGMLSFMFVLTIKFSVREQDLSRKYEPWMHGISISFLVVTAIMGAAMGMYGELNIGQFCWCAGEDATLFAYIVGGVPSFFFLFFIIVNNLLVYFHVRKNAKVSNQVKGASNDDKDRFRILRPTTSNGIGPRQASSSGSNLSSQSNESNESTFSNEHGTDLQTLRREEIRELQREEQRLRSLQDRSRARVQAVALQALFYVVIFIITYLPTFIIRIIAAAQHLTDETKIYPLLVIQAIFWPMQGFFNFLVYSRSPSYLREIEG